VTEQTGGRSVWGSKLGFILAASGSAIGLGNIVFFGANAYRFGGGAFYVPYFVALIVLGLPMMICELAIGKTQRAAFPGAMYRVAGKKGELIGWWSLLNATVIAMYYITILSWVGAMMIKSFGPLYSKGAASVGPTFGSVLTGWLPIIFVFIIWGLNILFLSKGTKTIEWTVKVFVPLMWLFMIGLVIRGLTLDGGTQGVWYLFTPDFEGIKSATVWQGAFSQMFFSLSLGLGTMTAYDSYLPKKTDVVASGGMVSFMNCGFEFIAGVAIFSMLFAFTLHPGAKTGALGMSLVVIPSGIAGFPAAQALFAFLFFLLLLIAGLTSSMSIIESPVAALRDKFGWSRAKALGLISSMGALGSIAFALPMVLNRAGKPAQPMGITLLELFDHWAFGYSLLVVGLVEAILIGWFYGISKLRAQINETARFKLGSWFDVLIKYIVPTLIGTVLLFNILGELGVTVEALGIRGKGFYKGDGGVLDGFAWLPMAVFFVWLMGTFVGAWLLTRSGSYDRKGDSA
jgi:NSS family neurotransmitter:Na+ symporter